jgi:hypothetical protein
MTSNTFCGSAFCPVVYLEVIPLLFSSSDDAALELSNFSVKHFLQRQTRKAQLALPAKYHDSSQSILQIEWILPRVEQDGSSTTTGLEGNGNGLALGYLQNGQEKRRAFMLGDLKDAESGSQRESFPVFGLPSNDPMVLEPVPCALKVHAPHKFLSSASSRAMITSAALVRVLSPQKAVFVSTTSSSVPSEPSLSLPSSWNATASYFRQQLSGEIGHDFLPKQLQAEVLSNHNTDTIQALSLRMSIQCSHIAQIGTTQDAFQLRKRAISRSRGLQEAVQSRLQTTSGAPLQRAHATVQKSETSKSTKRSIPWEPSLLVHSRNHADGKTMLIQAIAEQIGCSRVHLLRPGPLLAHYGIHADTALESLLHGILVSAAATPDAKPVCIILDHLDAMMPPQLSGRSGAGDAAIPVFNAIGTNESFVSCEVAVSFLQVLAHQILSLLLQHRISKT